MEEPLRCLAPSHIVPPKLGYWEQVRSVFMLLKVGGPHIWQQSKRNVISYKVSRRNILGTVRQWSSVCWRMAINSGMAVFLLTGNMLINQEVWPIVTNRDGPAWWVVGFLWLRSKQNLDRGVRRCGKGCGLNSYNKRQDWKSMASWFNQHSVSHVYLQKWGCKGPGEAICLYAERHKVWTDRNVTRKTMWP